MLDANNFTFLKEFDYSWNGSYIVSTTDTEGLEKLADVLKERKKTSAHPFKVYQFDKSKRKFTKISMQKFITVADFCTPLNVVLNEIYGR